MSVESPQIPAAYQRRSRSRLVPSDSTFIVWGNTPSVAGVLDRPRIRPSSQVQAKRSNNNNNNNNTGRTPKVQNNNNVRRQTNRSNAVKPPKVRAANNNNNNNNKVKRNINAKNGNGANTVRQTSINDIPLNVIKSRPQLGNLRMANKQFANAIRERSPAIHNNIVSKLMSHGEIKHALSSISMFISPEEVAKGNEVYDDGYINSEYLREQTNSARAQRRRDAEHDMLIPTYPGVQDSPFSRIAITYNAYVAKRHITIQLFSNGKPHYPSISIEFHAPSLIRSIYGSIFTPSYERQSSYILIRCNMSFENYPEYQNDLLYYLAVLMSMFVSASGFKDVLPVHVLKTDLNFTNNNRKTQKLPNADLLIDKIEKELVRRRVLSASHELQRR